MFGEQFFPTPPHIIEKMIEPYLKPGGYRYGNVDRTLTILEPSAGKGDILDYIFNKYPNSKNNISVYSIECDQNLKYILQEKGYNVIADDFLTYHGDYFFDLILMNPPFSNGDEHILKAWDILEQGDLCCLLNEETVKNPYSEKRKHLVSLIAAHGSVEWLGPCFSDAERKTNVNVAMVRLKKEAKKRKLDFEFESVTSEEKMRIDEDILKDAIATRDVVGNLILQYDKLKEVFIEYMKINEGLKFYS